VKDLIWLAAVAMVRRTRRVRAHIAALGKLKTQENFLVGPGFSAAPGVRLEAGRNVSIGRGFVGMANAKIGDDVMISANVAFIGDDHEYGDPAVPITSQKRRPFSTIVVEGDNLIGYGTTILGNVTVGRGAIIGAGSLVTSDIPSGMICVGRPARPVRSRYEANEIMATGKAGHHDE
jgi:acetyltransferase-like isoleucine patch superfamily enzyme